MPNLASRNAAIAILLGLTVLGGIGSFFAYKYALPAAGLALMASTFSGAWSSLMLALNASHPDVPAIQGETVLASYVPPTPPVPGVPVEPVK
jgi:hypothetical protein